MRVKEKVRVRATARPVYMTGSEMREYFELKEKLIENNAFVTAENTYEWNRLNELTIKYQNELYALASA